MTQSLLITALLQPIVKRRKNGSFDHLARDFANWHGLCGNDRAKTKNRWQSRLPIMEDPR
ncbi:hypothetical protein TH5_06720 [Thalassospira xianhensis MCCC 1A02616]|uniref:Uncharacterized protein n=1 Tax=Thalassospira xianhensis MCCC 1A02616 TaxID=1177929 RepID=A0A367UGP1_9PROT|nr:hypothetical protein TH5_06720 [Thalassospira xianhensis MCCC 1A02616]